VSWKFYFIIIEKYTGKFFLIFSNKPRWEILWNENFYPNIFNIYPGYKNFTLGYKIFTLGYEVLSLGYEAFSLGHEALSLGYEALSLGSRVIRHPRILRSLDTLGY